MSSHLARLGGVADAAGSLHEIGAVVVGECLQHLRLYEARHGLAAQARACKNSRIRHACGCGSICMMSCQPRTTTTPAQAGDAEARCLLGGEHDGLHRLDGLEARRAQRMQRGDRAQRAQRAVVRAPQHHSVRVRPRHHRACTVAVHASGEPMHVTGPNDSLHAWPQKLAADSVHAWESAQAFCWTEHAHVVKIAKCSHNCAC